MASIQQVNAIEEYAKGFSVVTNAEITISFCKRENIPCSLSIAQLSAAMTKMPYWLQGVSNCLDFVEAYEAAYRRCGKRRNK